MQPTGQRPSINAGDLEGEVFAQEEVLWEGVFEEQAHASPDGRLVGVLWADLQDFMLVLTAVISI